MELKVKGQWWAADGCDSQILAKSFQTCPSSTCVLSTKVRKLAICTVKTQHEGKDFSRSHVISPVIHQGEGVGIDLIGT